MSSMTSAKQELRGQQPSSREQDAILLYSHLIPFDGGIVSMGDDSAAGDRCRVRFRGRSRPQITQILRSTRMTKNTLYEKVVSPGLTKDGG